MFIVAAIVLGLLGSLHCVGMCGPIALALPLNRERVSLAAGGILLYNFGRALTYSIFGMLSGLAGSAVQWAGGQQVLSITAGIIVLLALVLGLLGKKSKLPSLIAKPFAKLNQTLGALFRRKRMDALLLIGLLNGILPCGLVYAGLAGAAATGSAWQGALFMFSFGMGTVPAMFALSFFGNRVPETIRVKLRKAVPVFVGMMALLLVLRGMGLGIPYISPAMEKGQVTCPHCHPKK